MRSHLSLFRLSTALAIGGLVFGPALAPLARAQTAEPPAAPGPGTDTAAPVPVDPPSRVGRVGALTGTVSYHTADQTDWQFAMLNYPVTSGNDFWTEPNANAALGLGGAKLVLDQQTEADIDTLDDATLAVTEPQGAIYLHVRALTPNSGNTVTTPRGVVTVTAAGHYEIVAGDADEPTRVVVIDGAAQIAVGDVTLQVGPQQAASITGSDAASFQGSVGVASNDPFITAELAKEQPPAPAVAQATATAAPATPAYTPPPLVQAMTGYESLETVGQWQPSPQYGHVWYPPVQSNWVPYRDGHWAYVAPWGWTWVDNAPWGFAPFHYGRWSRFGERWGWVPYQPGVQVDLAVERPVYAPALVSFVGIGAALGGGVGVGVGIGLGGGISLSASIGWVPLAPDEPYYPPYHTSPAYLRNVNVTHVSNVTNITTVTNNTTTINNYANASAATVVPAATMTSSAPVAAAVQHVTRQQLAAAKPVAQAPVLPTATTAGVTPTVARQFHLPPAAVKPAAAGKPGQVAARKPAPGPAITPPPLAAAVAEPAKPAAVGAKPAGAAAAKEGTAAAPKEGVAATPATAAKLPPAAAAKEGTAPAPKEPAPVAAKEGVAAAPKEPAAKEGTVIAPKEPAATQAAKPAEPAKAAGPAAKPALPALAKPNPAKPTPSTHAAPTPARPTAAKPTAAKPTPEARPAPAAKPAPAPAVKSAPAPKPAAASAPKPAAAPAPKPAPAPQPPKPAAAAKPAPQKTCPAGEKTC